MILLKILLTLLFLSFLVSMVGIVLFLADVVDTESFWGIALLICMGVDLVFSVGYVVFMIIRGILEVWSL